MPGSLPAAPLIHVPRHPLGEIRFDFYNLRIMHSIASAARPSRRAWLWFCAPKACSRHDFCGEHVERQSRGDDPVLIRELLKIRVARGI